MIKARFERHDQAQRAVSQLIRKVGIRPERIELVESDATHSSHGSGVTASKDPANQFRWLVVVECADRKDVERVRQVLPYPFVTE
tara:strand:+ start:11424 stop:11678 length:255 start_codon:yes stop_codon:yes gene_type:complete